MVDERIFALPHFCCGYAKVTDDYCSSFADEDDDMTPPPGLNEARPHSVVSEKFSEVSTSIFSEMSRKYKIGDILIHFLQKRDLGGKGKE